ncbi:agmatinase [uncultured Aquimarina sp.]|uniref:agmatinase n=1 Tax=uncultured Aquimarina sp. TaxID=575652 RepID=UPI002624CA60|nr:agmatinase [uncultured Aquimarina sp.]
MKIDKTYAGIDKEYASYEKSKVVLIPVPYDGTSTWGKGADKGPEAFLHASENMELYDIETDTEVYKQGIYLADEVTENNSPDVLVEAVHRIIKANIKRNKFVTMFGGEHSVSIGAIRAFNECFDDLTVLQIDAHADLRKEYDGSPFNHACALYEANESTNLIQVGIRSMDISEKSIMNEENVFFAHDMATDDYWIDNVVDLLGDNVYITFDLDALDPSIMPSTGTPEPGGLFWYETLGFLKKVFEEKNVVGFDIVELCPNEIDKSSDFLAAKLYYKMLSYKFSKKNEGEENDNLYTFQKGNTINKLKYNNDED